MRVVAVGVGNVYRSDDGAGLAVAELLRGIAPGIEVVTCEQEPLRLLDAYQTRFPRRSLGTEATVLRIETLTKRGDRAQAARLGRDFLARNADGPYARRVRSLLGEPAQP